MSSDFPPSGLRLQTLLTQLGLRSGQEGPRFKSDLVQPVAMVGDLANNVTEPVEARAFSRVEVNPPTAQRGQWEFFSLGPAGAIVEQLRVDSPNPNDLFLLARSETPELHPGTGTVVVSAQLGGVLTRSSIRWHESPFLPPGGVRAPAFELLTPLRWFVPRGFYLLVWAVQPVNTFTVQVVWRELPDA